MTLYNLLQHMQALKGQREAKCKKSTTCGTRYLCKTCRKLRKRMCEDYHILDKHPCSSSNTAVQACLAKHELLRRLEYEYVFGILKDDDVLTGNFEEINARNFGHTKRIKRLVSMIFREHSYS